MDIMYITIYRGIHCNISTTFERYITIPKHIGTVDVLCLVCGVSQVTDVQHGYRYIRIENKGITSFT